MNKVYIRKAITKKLFVIGNLIFSIISNSFEIKKL